MNNASPFLPPIPKKKKKKDASLGWWCHLEAKVFCYAKPDRGVGFDRLFNCELFFLQGNWHLFAHITPSQSGKMNWQQRYSQEVSGKTSVCGVVHRFIKSVVYIYFLHILHVWVAPLWLFAVRRYFLKLLDGATRVESVSVRMLHLCRKSLVCSRRF